MLAFCKANENAARALLAGNIQLLGFEHVSESFGDKWPRVKARVRLLTESIIKKHISRDDIYVLANDEQFIVLFAKTDTALAERAPSVSPTKSTKPYTASTTEPRG